MGKQFLCALRALCVRSVPMSDYVELSNLTKIYPTAKGPAVIVKDFNLRIKKGEFVTLKIGRAHV